MAQIETKFAIGDVAYCGRAKVVTKQLPCPDCHGTRKWKATSPAGTEYEFSCPRCSAHYQSSDALNLNYQTWEPEVITITINSIEANRRPDAPAGDSWANRTRYMESKTGSGTVFDEEDLVADAETAMIRAKLKVQALLEDAKRPANILYNKRLELSDYQLTEARELGEERVKSEAVYFVGQVLEDIVSVAELYDWSPEALKGKITETVAKFEEDAAEYFASRTIDKSTKTDHLPATAEE